MVPLPLRSDPLSVQQTWTGPEEQSAARTCAVCGWPVVEFQLWTAVVQFGQGEPKQNYCRTTEHDRFDVDDYPTCCVQLGSRS